MDAALQIILFTFSVEIIRTERFKFDFRAVTQQSLHFQQMFAGAPVHHGIGATRIIADHSADHRTVGC